MIKKSYICIYKPKRDNSDNFYKIKEYMEFLVAGFEIIEQEPGLGGMYKVAELRKAMEE